MSQMRKTSFEKKWELEQYELAIDRKYKADSYFGIVDLAKKR